MRPPTYDPESVRPMWEELEKVGISSLTTSEEVEEFVAKKTGISLVVINSVCGCAAGNARPGVMLALQNKVIPDNLATVFAGVHLDAVDKARSFMSVPPSSPCVGIFKDGDMIHALERNQIEQMSAGDIAQNLAEVFNKHCKASGPSIPKEEFEKIDAIKKCGSSIPLFGE